MRDKDLNWTICITSISKKSLWSAPALRSLGRCGLQRGKLHQRGKDFNCLLEAEECGSLQCSGDL